VQFIANLVVKARIAP